ncbi:ABC transporter permease [Arthrobacter sp. NPDC090010]|uniref:ABC transporter permease n=1 Tax=Arthrobacter sp. NPDC090010 TaxID=3363942 RepID=UPI00382F173A
MSTHRLPAVKPLTPQKSRFWPSGKSWGSILLHLLIPLVMGAGMAFAYLGGFHAPAPHNVPLAVVGTGPEAKVFAQTLNDKGDGKLQVSTLATEADARQQIIDQKITAAYVPSKDHATLMVSNASSQAGAATAEEVFLPIAYQQHLPVDVQDVRPGNENDPAGQALFFMLVAMSVGSYASVIALAAATAKLRVGVRLLTAAGVGLVMSGISTLVAGPVYHVLSGNEWGIWLMGALYSFGIVTVGLGLHPILGKWTTPALTLLFVMFNFTSSGGVFPSFLSPAFFSGLNTFWNGAAWLTSAKDLTYFPGAQFGFEGLKLALWALVGVGLVLATHLATVKKRQLADDTLPISREEEESSLVAAG